MTHAQASQFGIRIILLGALAGLASGCASYRLHSSLLPVKPAPAVQAQAETKYVIKAAQFISPTNLPSGSIPDFITYKVNPDKFSNKLMTLATRARPDLFSSDPAAVPVEVTVTKVACDLAIPMKENCISCLTLTIIPLYSADKENFTVEVTMTEPAGGKKISLPIAFSFEERNWMSILPWGWLPVPGGRGSYAWGTSSAYQKYDAMMLDSCVEAAATALGHKEPSAWKAP